MTDYPPAKHLDTQRTIWDRLRQVDFSNAVDGCWAETPPFHSDYSSVKTEWVENIYLTAQRYASDWTSKGRFPSYGYFGEY